MSTATPPPQPIQGTPVIDYLRKLIAYVKAMRVNAGPGLIATQSPNGITISIANRAAADAEPYTVTVGTALTVNVKEGTMYGAGFTSSGDSRSASNLAVSANTTNYIYVEADLDAAPAGSAVQYYWEFAGTTSITAYGTSQSNVGTLPTGTSGTAYLQLARVTTNGTAVTDVTQDWSGNVELITGIGFFLWGKR